MTEIEDKRKVIQQLIIKTGEDYYFGKLDGLNDGVEMARKEFKDNLFREQVKLFEVYEEIEKPEDLPVRSQAIFYFIEKFKQSLGVKE